MKMKELAFVWMNEKTELLLMVMLEYTVVKVAENVDWESVRCKC